MVGGLDLNRIFDIFLQIFFRSTWAPANACDMFSLFWRLGWDVHPHDWLVIHRHAFHFIGSGVTWSKVGQHASLPPTHGNLKSIQGWLQLGRGPRWWTHAGCNRGVRDIALHAVASSKFAESSRWFATLSVGKQDMFRTLFGISGNNNAGTLQCKCGLCPTKVTRGRGKTYPKAQPIYRDWKLLSRVLLRVKHLTIFSSDHSLIYTYRDILYNMCRGQRVPLWGIVMLCSWGFYVSTQCISPYAWIHGHPMSETTGGDHGPVAGRSQLGGLQRQEPCGWVCCGCVEPGAKKQLGDIKYLLEHPHFESITAEKSLMSKNNEKYVFLYFLQEKQCFWASYLSVCFAAGMWPFSVHDIQTAF